jgi:hypothetical protein
MMLPTMSAVAETSVSPRTRDLEEPAGAGGLDMVWILDSCQQRLSQEPAL